MNSPFLFGLDRELPRDALGLDVNRGPFDRLAGGVDDLAAHPAGLSQRRLAASSSQEPSTPTRGG